VPDEKVQKKAFTGSPTKHSPGLCKGKGKKEGGHQKEIGNQKSEKSVSNRVNSQDLQKRLAEKKGRAKVNYLRRGGKAVPNFLVKTKG